MEDEAGQKTGEDVCVHHYCVLTKSSVYSMLVATCGFVCFHPTVMTVLWWLLHGNGFIDEHTVYMQVKYFQVRTAQLTVFVKGGVLREEVWL